MMDQRRDFANRAAEFARHYQTRPAHRPGMLIFRVANRGENRQGHDAIAKAWFFRSVHDFPSNGGPLQLQRFECTASQRGGALATVISTTTVNGRLFGGVTSCAPFWSRDTLNGFTERLQNELDAASE